MKKLACAALVTASALVLAGCSGDATPAVTTPAASESAPAPELPSSTPTPTPEAEAERGTRANPLAIGESRKLSGPSMFSVGASAPTEVRDGYVILPFAVGLDWEAGDKQATDGGTDKPSEAGIDPFFSLTVEFVSASGRSFTTMDDYMVEIAEPFSMVGTVYPPTDVVSANVAVSVPADQVEGGVWVAKNSRGEQVFIASR